MNPLLLALSTGLSVTLIGNQIAAQRLPRISPPVPQGYRRLAQDAQWKWPHLDSRLLEALFWVPLVLICYITLSSLFFGLVAATLYAVCSGAANRFANSLEEKRFTQHLPAVLDQMASSVRSGASLIEALSDDSVLEGPARDDFKALTVAVKLGSPLATQLDAWSARRGSDARLVATSMKVALETGSSVAPVLEMARDALISRQQLHDEIMALTSQARLSAVVMSILPPGFAVLMSALDPNFAHLLFGTLLGHILLTIGVGLDLLGGLWMRKLGNQ